MPDRKLHWDHREMQGAWGKSGCPWDALFFFVWVYSIKMPRSGILLHPLLQALNISCCDYSNHIQYRQPQNLVYISVNRKMIDNFLVFSAGILGNISLVCSTLYIADSSTSQIIYGLWGHLLSIAQLYLGINTSFRAG